MKKKKNLIFKTAFNDYRINETIEGGGSGTVYKVRDEDSQIYALKCLEPSRLTRQKVKRFRNELYFCFKTDHENIIKISDWGSVQLEEKDCPFYIMPYYPKTLRKLMKEGISDGQVLHYFSQILDGVEAAHLQGIWHRDLKPENILYDPNSDRLVIADFGIAHFSEGILQTAVETGTQERLANFLYSAPEQRMKGKDVDNRADIYALGVILNEMFTGEVLQGTSYKKISGIATDYSYLDELVDIMVKQSPDERPNAINDIKKELIARKNDFVTEQKLKQLSKKVVPVTEVDDPLINDPIRLINLDFTPDMKFILTLSQPVNDAWVQVFRAMHIRTRPAGMGPNDFRFHNKQADIRYDENCGQQLVDQFKSYLSQANDNYKKKVIRDQKLIQAQERKQLQKEREKLERRKQVLSDIKI